MFRPTTQLLLLAGATLLLSGPFAPARAGAQTGLPLPLSPAIVQGAPPSTDSDTRPALVEIRQARITQVEKFISRSKKTHFRFEFVVNQKTYRGIMFEGDWNSDHVARLRSGKATLIGYWDTYQGTPSFVAKTVKP